MGRIGNRTVPRPYFKRHIIIKNSVSLLKIDDSLPKSISREHDFKVWKKNKNKCIEDISAAIINDFTKHIQNLIDSETIDEGCSFIFDGSQYVSYDKIQNLTRKGISNIRHRKYLNKFKKNVDHLSQKVNKNLDSNGRKFVREQDLKTPAPDFFGAWQLLYEGIEHAWNKLNDEDDSATSNNRKNGKSTINRSYLTSTESTMKQHFHCDHKSVLTGLSINRSSRSRIAQESPMTVKGYVRRMLFSAILSVEDHTYLYMAESWDKEKKSLKAITKVPIPLHHILFFSGNKIHAGTYIHNVLLKL